MPKLAIYVPKQEMREIERWRKTLNFSRIFMKALRQEIQRRTQLAGVGGDEVAKAAEHYRQLLADDDHGPEELGHQLGRTHVLECKLTPSEIRSVLRLQGRSDWTEDEEKLVRRLAGGKNQLSQMATNREWTQQSHPTWEASLLNGYVEGVAAAWERVCEHLRRHH